MKHTLAAGLNFIDIFLILLSWMSPSVVVVIGGMCDEWWWTTLHILNKTNVVIINIVATTVAVDVRTCFGGGTIKICKYASSVSRVCARVFCFYLFVVIPPAQCVRMWCASSGLLGLGTKRDRCSRARLSRLLSMFNCYNILLQL